MHTSLPQLLKYNYSTFTARGSTGLDLFKLVKHYHRDGPTIKHVYAVGSDAGWQHML